MQTWPAEGPLLFAHRGAPLTHAENTLPGFARALALGADVLELDVRMSADGQIVVCHDETGARLCGRQQAVSATTLAELKSWQVAAAVGVGKTAQIAALSELLEQLPEALLNIDVKQREPDMLPALLRLLREHGAQQRVLLTSFSVRTLGRLRLSGYAGPLGMSQLDAMRAVLLPGACNRIMGLARGRLQIPTSYGPLALATRSRIAALHAQGLKVDYWVINDIAQAEQLLDRGADGIVTDDCERVAQLFASHPRCTGWRQRHGRS